MEIGSQKFRATATIFEKQPNESNQSPNGRKSLLTTYIQGEQIRRIFAGSLKIIGLSLMLVLFLTHLSS
jgi:hypothetical protein